MSLDRFLPLSRLSWVAHLLGLTITLTLLASYLLLVSLPLHKNAQDAAHEVASLSPTVIQRESTLEDLTRLKSEFATASRRAEQMRNRIAENRQEAEILEQLSSFAAEQNLTILDYRLGRVRQLDRISQFEVDLRCMGSFAGACSLVDEIHHLEQLAVVDELQIETAEVADRYPINLKLTLYYRTPDRTAGQRPEPDAGLVASLTRSPAGSGSHK